MDPVAMGSRDFVLGTSVELQLLAFGKRLSSEPGNGVMEARVKISSEIETARNQEAPRDHTNERPARVPEEHGE